MVLKIISPDITHKTDVGGVALDLETPEIVSKTAEAMIERVRNARPDARILGFVVQPMIRRLHAHELIIGVIDDAQFGPVLLFGHGGTAVEVIRDTALALPPLNMHLAREVISRTRIYGLLKSYRGMPGADLDGIALTLVKVSQLVTDIAEIAEIDINPLLADERSVLALDVRIKVARAMVAPAQRLAIRPYPKELEESVSLPDGRTLELRPVRPEDEPGFHALFAKLSPEEIRLRFLHPMKILTHDLAARLTQIDYDREMALVLVGQDRSGEPELCGAIRISADSDNERAEFSILLRHDMTGMGFGPMLMRRIIEYARNRGIGEIFGEVLSNNKNMLKLCQAFGFTIRYSPGDPGVMMVSLKL